MKTSAPLCRRLLVLALALVSLPLAGPLGAQGPAADWRTLETASFRFFYPAEAEDFTRYTAARLEAARERVAHEVGYRTPGRTEVVVVDPVAAANGSAWPLQRWPRLMLFATPPGPDSGLGYYDDWVSELVLHEEVHLAHLLRPSRRPLESRLGALLPLGPVGRKSPTWATEGYATYLEGKMTGYGRPHADFRPSLLRRWAQQGYLPSYGELNGSPQRFLGGSFPYLVGSAFLEWLVEREGEASLRHLWARLSAVESRDFDDAFAGVFGEPPAILYRRFCAELTHAAMEAEAAEQAESAAAGRGSELWQTLGGRPSAPALSSDGAYLAIAERPIGEPARLVVYATAPDPEAAKKEEEQRAKLLAADPEDVPAVRRKPLPAKKLKQLQAIDGGDFLTPRFFADGKALLLARLEPDADGRLIPDLYRFEISTGELRRLTRGAGLRDASPLPDGKSAIALRFPYGRSELVQVDLESGEEQILDAPPFPVTLAQPRVSPDGRTLALVVHRETEWRLELRPLAEDPAGGAARTIEMPPRSLVTDPAWSADGRFLYATVGAGGRLDLYRFDLESGAAERLTREPGAAYGAAPGEKEIYFLALESNGYDLRRATLPPAGAAPRLAAAAPLPASSPAAGAAVLVARRPELPANPLALAEPPAGRPYGGGPLEWLPLIGGGSGPDGPTYELGLRAGDPVGRREALALASAGAVRGGALQLRWRGWPWQLGADVFGFEEDGNAYRAETDQQGLALGLTRQWQGRSFGYRAEAGAAWQQVERGGGADEDQTRFYLRAGADWRRDFGVFRLTARGRFDGAHGDRDRGGSFQLARGSGRLELAYEPYRGQASILGLELGAGEADHADFELGGRHGSLLPSAFEIERLEMPGLAAGILAGERFERARADLELAGLPLRLFGEKYRWDRGDSTDEEISYWGLELQLDWRPNAFLRLPGGRARLGAIEILEGELEDEIELYLTLSWRP